MSVFYNTSSIKLPILSIILLLFNLIGHAQQTKKIVSEVYLSKVNSTNDGMEKSLEKQTNLYFQSGKKDTATYTITIDPGKTYQEMDGFGASFTEASAFLVQKKLSKEQRDMVMHKLFSSKNGIGLSMLRQPIGASDHVIAPYTFDDVKFPDTTLSRFSIDHDMLYKIPSLQHALSIEPGRIKISCATWSPPAWMKQNNSILGDSNNIIGRLRPDCYNAYANYIIRFIDEYAKNGIPVYATSIQNEPDHASNMWPAMKMGSDEQVNLIKNFLGPKLKDRNIKIWCWDHNFDTPQYPDGQFVKNVYKDTAASKYVSGSAWHWYGGKMKTLFEIDSLYPSKEIHFTEGSGGEWNPVKRWHDGFMELMRYMINLPRANCKSIVLWNVALDEQNGPDYYYRSVKSQSTCRGLITINQTTGNVTFNVDYYAMGQLSKFVDPGAKRIFSNQWDNVMENVAFKNPDGTLVLLVCNRTKELRKFNITFKGLHLKYSIAPETTATFKWKDVSSNLIKK